MCVHRLPVNRRAASFRLFVHEIRPVLSQRSLGLDGLTHELALALELDEIGQLAVAENQDPISRPYYRAFLQTPAARQTPRRPRAEPVPSRSS